MTKTRILFLALAATLMLTFIAGCSTTTSANAKTVLPDNNGPVSATDSDQGKYIKCG